MHLKMTSYSPCLHAGSSTLTAGITIHYVSARKGCKGPGRSSRHISLSRPVSEIITSTDKLPGSLFFVFFILLSFIKQVSGFRTRVLFLVPYLKSRSCPPSEFGGFFQGPFPHSSLSPASKRKSKSPFCHPAKHGSCAEPGTSMFTFSNVVVYLLTTLPLVGELKLISLAKKHE